MDLILASTSRYRREQLARLGIPFRCLAPGVDEEIEKAAGWPPRELCERLALAKAAIDDFGTHKLNKEQLGRFAQTVTYVPQSAGPEALAAAVAAHDASHALTAIRAPTLVLTGADDELIPPRLQAALASDIPGAAQRTIAGAGHAVTLDQPEASARAVLAFVLGRQPRTR